MQDHSEKHFEELALISGRPILYNAIAVNDVYPERFRAPDALARELRQARHPRLSVRARRSNSASPSPSRIGTCGTICRRGANAPPGRSKIG